MARSALNFFALSIRSKVLMLSDSDNGKVALWDSLHEGHLLDLRHAIRNKHTWIIKLNSFAR